MVLGEFVKPPYLAPSEKFVKSPYLAPSEIVRSTEPAHGRAGKDRAYHWRTAYGSAREVETHLRLLIGAGVIEADRALATIRLFDEVRAMTWRLLHPQL
ncbi:MAG TPA: four helix bundle protein [Candidatus Sulfomarinibacteraceae bacterium]|nr:four helix bundle protein [Candidatus Sulfomarinibacteraceae bacterium]